jgi:hypothetical protein
MVAVAEGCGELPPDARSPIGSPIDSACTEPDNGLADRMKPMHGRFRRHAARS